MKHIVLSLTILSTLVSSAQDCRIPTSADNLTTYGVADCVIPFDVKAKGRALPVKWGMDAAWDWDFNVNRGIAHIGVGNFETGRVSFQPNDLVTDNGDGTYTLSAAQQQKLLWRINLIKSTGATEANLNCDHEALFERDANGNIISRKGYENYCGKPLEWYKLIKASVQFCKKNGLKIVSVSPFNEPDYGWSQYAGDESNGMKDFLSIAKRIKNDSYFNGINVCGGNTLNCDRALPWYNYLKNFLDEGNTHQLAGSFDTYANFFATVKADGKIGTGDELHNVGEAIVGVQYGMQNGIWWAFDAKARGQFCLDSNQGVRIGYGEDRPHWTAGAVYRNDQTGEVHGFLGSSERQANTSTYEFVSKGRDVFFRGNGPTRHWQYTLPGGGGYQDGQINAELLFDITWGDDVEPMPEVNGTFQLMNASSKKLLTFNNGNNVQCMAQKNNSTQQWHIYPGHTDADCSYWFIDNAGDQTAHLNLKNLNLSDGASVITFNAGHAHEEQWYLKYAKDGYYYIIARLSNKYLFSGGATISLKSLPDDATDATLKRYLWRLLPVGAKAETEAPAAPTILAARQRVASIELSWAAPTDGDVTSYTILRREASSDEWNTIARQITTTAYVDNSVKQGCAYEYKVLAVDLSGNRSLASSAIGAAPLTERSLVCQLQFDKTLTDATDNHIDATMHGTAKYVSYAKSGSESLQLEGQTYALLPCAVGDYDEMTIATWVRLGNTAAWQRVFDFGNDTDHYMFFTPSNGGEMRFEMKNGGSTQILTNGQPLTTSTTAWKHVAVTLRPLDGGKVEAVLYVDGNEAARRDDFTIKPSDIAPSLCYLGRSMFKADPLFSGRIDDFRIYNYALSANEVKALLDDTGAIAEGYRDHYKDTTTGITQPTASYHATATYDLSGRLASRPTGVVIQNGKKIYKTR